MNCTFRGGAPPSGIAELAARNVLVTVIVALVVSDPHALETVKATVYVPADV